MRAIVKEHGEHLEALENGEPFVPRLTGKAANKKRKHKGKGKTASSKRRKTTPDSDDDFDDFIVSDDASDNDSDSDQSDDSNAESDDESGHENSGFDPEQEAEGLVSENDLKATIEEGKEKIKDHRRNLTEARERKKDASDNLARLKKSLAKEQRDKNAFCSRKRSEVRICLPFERCYSNLHNPAVLSRCSKGGFPHWA